MQRLQGKRVLLTQADGFMGPATEALFTEEGAEVIADRRDLSQSGACEELIAGAGEIDVLVINLESGKLKSTAVPELTPDLWDATFAALVTPLQQLVSAAAPAMIERGRGKIVVYGSAAPLRPMPNLSYYSAARAAQHGFVKAAGAELAEHNVHLNLIAQNWVENPTYYGPEVQAKPWFSDYLKSNVPLGRLATGREDAALALFLASDESDFFVGQNIPFTGGWV